MINREIRPAITMRRIDYDQVVATLPADSLIAPGIDAAHEIYGGRLYRWGFHQLWQAQRGPLSADRSEFY
jgi:hypothetical protein